jgi:hypothetical protein
MRQMSLFRPCLNASVLPQTVILRYYEHLSIRPRQLWWLLGVAAAAVVGGLAIAIPALLVSLIYSLLRFSRSDIRIDDHYLQVGKKRMPLIWLDPATLGQPRNIWPWFWFSKRKLACVPFWTKESLGIGGKDQGGKKIYVSLGTNERDKLIGALLGAIHDAKSQPGSPQMAYQQATHTRQPAQLTAQPMMATMTPTTQPTVRPLVGPPGWFADPWDPVRHVRWFDGYSWTGYRSPMPTRHDTQPAQPAQQPVNQWWGPQ